MLGILHISDVHFKVGNNLALQRISQIKAAIRSENYDLDDLLLVISGDIAFSGKSAEYVVAKQFISDLEQSLQMLDSATFLGTVVIPGNHDCNFENEGEVRPALLSTIAERIESVDTNGDFVKQLLTVQSEFFSFEAQLSGNSKPRDQGLMWTHIFASSAGRTLVRCFNTAWLSRKKSNKANFIFLSML